MSADVFPRVTDSRQYYENLREQRAIEAEQDNRMERIADDLAGIRAALEGLLTVARQVTNGDINDSWDGDDPKGRRAVNTNGLT